MASSTFIFPPDSMVVDFVLFFNILFLFYQSGFVVGKFKGRPGVGDLGASSDRWPKRKLFHFFFSMDVLGRIF